MATDNQNHLNRINPVAADVKLGDTLQEMINQINALTTAFNAVLTKLDADVGINDTDYSSIHNDAAVVTDLNDR